MQQQRLRIDFVMSSWVDAFSNNCHHTLSYTAYKLYVLPRQCAGFHPLLSSLHKKLHENLVANRASGGRLFMVKKGIFLGKKGWLIRLFRGKDYELRTSCRFIGILSWWVLSRPPKLSLGCEGLVVYWFRAACLVESLPQPSTRRRQHDQRTAEHRPNPWKKCRISTVNMEETSNFLTF